MSESMWGLLGPEALSSSRRTRTLGLGASVRHFNDLAVPGLGGVWYGKQLLLATLGVAVAQEARRRGSKVQNIEVANAIEALACWLAFNSNGWRSDPRLRGNSKLQGKDDFSFRRVRQRNFYVTQPMRMATVQALPALGFVESDSVRFNTFQCLDDGVSFIEKASGGSRPHNRTVVDHLTFWAQMKDDRIETNALREVLSPLTRLSDQAIPLLRERLIQGGDESLEDKLRRANALAWVETLRRAKTTQQTWMQRPGEITQEHWNDLQSGAMFFQARDAAIATLDAAESYMGIQTDGKAIDLKKQVPDSLLVPIEKLNRWAKAYFDFKSTDEDAQKFCEECLVNDPISVLRSLVKRDSQVLRLVGEEIKPGPAFRGSQTPTGLDDEQEIPQAQRLSLPDGISYRVRNLYLLNLDMHGELDAWLDSNSTGSDE